MSEDRRQYLPPGSMRKERRSGVIEGMLLASMAFLVVLMMIAILLLAILRSQTSGCCAQSCCVTPDADKGITPNRLQNETRSIPEPGTLALVGAGIIGWRLIA